MRWRSKFAIVAKVWDGSLEDSGNQGRDDRRRKGGDRKDSCKRSLDRQRTPKLMDMHIYPGRGLSLSQLVFALNKELKRVAYSPLWVEIEITPD